MDGWALRLGEGVGALVLGMEEEHAVRLAVPFGPWAPAVQVGFTHEETFGMLVGVLGEQEAARVVSTLKASGVPSVRRFRRVFPSGVMTDWVDGRLDGVVCTAYASALSFEGGPVFRGDPLPMLRRWEVANGAPPLAVAELCCFPNVKTWVFGLVERGPEGGVVALAAGHFARRQAAVHLGNVEMPMGGVSTSLAW